MKHHVALLSLVMAFLPACGGNPGAVAVRPTARETLSLKLQTAHFHLLADRAPSETLRGIADALEANCARIAADLEVADDLRTTTVEVWTDTEAFYSDMQATIGSRFEGATGYVTGPADVALLVGPNPSRTAVHEFSHCVAIRLNASIANNPRWLWETVALYENREFVDPRTVGFLRSGDYPTIAQLDVSYDTGHQIYQVGYVLGEFIVADWGQSGLARLVRGNGDIERVFGITVAEFERRWHLFLREKYPQSLVVGSDRSE